MPSGDVSVPVGMPMAMVALRHVRQDTQESLWVPLGAGTQGRRAWSPVPSHHVNEDCPTTCLDAHQQPRKASKFQGSTLGGTQPFDDGHDRSVC